MEAMGELAAGGALRWAGLPADAAAAAQQASLQPPAVQPPVARLRGLLSVPLEQHSSDPASDDGGPGVLARSLKLLKRAGSMAVADAALFSFREAADFAADIEEFSRVAEYLQIVAAGAVDRSRRQAAAAARSGSGVAVGWTTGWAAGAVVQRTTGWAANPDAEAAADPESAVPSEPKSAASACSAPAAPVDDGCRNAVEFLRARLRISAGEARRRIVLAESVLPRTGFTGHDEPPERPELGAALAAGAIGSRPATIITTALDRVRHHAPEDTTALMEHSLVSTAAKSDTDFLSRIARRWVEAIDQNGTEPSEAELRHRQGAFIRQARRGLHHLEIFATPDQYEHLLTVMNTATNPRTSVAGDGAGDGAEKGHCVSDMTGTPDPALDWRTRPQRLLDGLICACKAALATGTLPAAGGLPPQVMVTIDYRDLLDRLEHAAAQGPHHRAGTGSFTFTGPVTAATVRKIACDADIIPVLLGSDGRILDIGRTTRVFPPHIRKAITARDQGCAFPACTIPSPWCEAHHISYWSHGGTTSTENGTLLCSHHHHLIHKEEWTIQNRSGVPWFIPPPHIDPHQKPQRNGYFRC
jgi:hypothetical protein